MSTQSTTPDNDKIHWQRILNLASQHKAILIQAHIIALVAAVILVPVPMLMPLLVDEVLLDQPGPLVEAVNYLFPQNWYGPVLYILSIMFVTVFLRFIGTVLSVWQTREFTLVAKDITFSFRLNRDKLRKVRRREGRYLLRTNLAGHDPAKLWQLYIQLVEVEAAFKTLKDDLGLRPIYHQLEHRIEAHIFVAFIAYCLHVTLRARLKPLAAGLTPRAVLDKFAAIQMIDVHFPTTDGRTLILSRYTEPTADQKILLKQLNLVMPAQPPPRITAAGQLAHASS